MTARERMAAHCHSQWSGWMKYLFKKSTFNADGTVTIPAWAVSRWKRQMDTEYEQLTEVEKDSDRMEADAILAVVPEIVEVCGRCGGDGYTIEGSGVLDYKEHRCEPCNGTGIRIKQDRQEGEDG